MGRLKRLEGVIEKLSGKGTESTSSASNEPSPVARKDDPVPNEQPRKETSSCPRSLDFDPKNRTPNELTNGFGRLVIEEGRSRYVSNRLWTSLGDEVCISSPSQTAY